MPDKPDLQAIRERAKKATAGPWHVMPNHWGEAYLAVGDPTSDSTSSLIGPYRLIAQRFDFDKNGWTDCDFIAHARQDIPDLLAYVERIESELARVTLENERLMKDFKKLQDKEYALWAACHVCGPSALDENGKCPKCGQVYSFNRYMKLHSERDEAVGLLRIIDDLLNYMVPSDAPSGKFRNVREQLRAFLSRLDQPQEK